jgi:hypothetical protein
VLKKGGRRVCGLWMDNPYKLAVLDRDVFLTLQGSDGPSVGDGQSVL